MSDELRSVEGDAWRIEQARAYMEHVCGLRLRIDALRAQRDKEREVLLPKGVRYDKAPSAPADSADDALVDGLYRLDLLDEKYKDTLRGYIVENAEAMQAIMSIGNAVYVRLLQCRYLEGRTWEKVGAAINYDGDYTRKVLHGRALLSLYDVMPHTWRAPRHSAL